MPALEDDREELLAQELAKGIAQGPAYVNAGYPAGNNNVASVQCNKLLKKKPEIRERAAELKSLARTDAYNAAFVVNLDTMTALYMEDRAHAKALGQVGAAISALGGVAKLHGLGSETVRNPDMADTLAKFLESVSAQPRLGK
jgi:hypothetical protein